MRDAGLHTRRNALGAGRQQMTSKDTSGQDAVVQAFTPDAAERLAVPRAASPVESTQAQGVNQRSQQSHAATAGRAAAPPASHPHGAERKRKLNVLKRLERYISAIFKLGRTEYMAKNARKRITAAELRMDAIEGELGKFGNDIRQGWERADQLSEALSEQGAGMSDRVDAASDGLSQLSERLDGIQTGMEAELRTAQSDAAVLRAETALLTRIFGDLSRRMDHLNPDRAGTDAPASAPAPTELPSTDGFDLFKDSFYHRLENRYRGSVEDIRNRLTIYLPDVEAAFLRTGRKPAMDIGCGRGEWLGLMKDNGINAFGIDTNAVQIADAREQGLDVRHGDALQALAGMEDASLSVLTAHHLVEHLPFDAVAWITREAMRVLAPGGLLLFETPHTRNVLVGATTFHTDPTHLKPMPEQVLTVLFETAGFDPVEARGLHPHERFDEFLAKPDFNDELAFLMFGPQDLAVLGTRPLGD